MIPIKIDKKNLELRALHIEKVKEKLEKLLTEKRDKYDDHTTFEYLVLDWIHWHLELILISKVEKLRKVISAFNSLLESYNKNIYLEQIKKINKVEYEKQKKEVLVNLLKFNDNQDIQIGDTSVAKKVYIDLIFKNKDKIKESAEFKYEILQYRINKIIKDIFEKFYKGTWDGINTYDRYTFVTKHNLKTCPYCNMGYILISKRDENKKNGLRPEIDHFFPKATYPYLAMSFYNLIPSCKVCNHTKSSKDTFNDGLLSPYEIDSSTFKLTYTPKNMNFLQIKKRKYNFNSFDIKFKKIDEHSNIYFKLDKLYEQHKDVVLELLIKRTIYSKSYIEELKQNFHFTDDEIYRFLFCNYKESDEFDKRPLSKLIKDITDELGFVRVGIR